VTEFEEKEVRERCPSCCCFQSKGYRSFLICWRCDDIFGGKFKMTQEYLPVPYKDLELE
jgi:hypothetical protein